MQHSRTFSSPPPPSLWIITMFPATRDLHLCQPQRLIFRHKRGNGMKTFLGFVHNGTKVEVKETHLALWAKKRRRWRNKAAKSCLPPFTPFPALEPLPSSSLKHIGLQSVHSNDQAPQNHENDHKHKISTLRERCAQA